MDRVVASCVAAALCWLAAGCAEPQRPQARARPASAHCSVVKIERVLRESDLPADTAILMLAYTPPDEAGPARNPVTAKVQVRRERADRLRAHLQAHPNVVCDPEPGAPGGYRVALPF